MSTKIAREALDDLLTVARHIDILATQTIHEDDIDALKHTLSQWAKASSQKQRDAVTNIVVLIEAIEDGVDITTLKEYKELKMVARTG